MALDTVVDENKNITGYKPINLVYTKARTTAKDVNVFDGEYILNWI